METMNKIVKLQSDYDPKTKLTIVRTEDGDICLRIYGHGEMRIAMSGSQLRGYDHMRIIEALNELISAIDTIGK